MLNKTYTGKIKLIHKDKEKEPEYFNGWEELMEHIKKEMAMNNKI